jgi:zinc transport system permease protein
MDDFVWRGILGGLGLAVVAGPLGAFVVWRRMAYFGDTIAHSALLGVALGFLLDVPFNLGITLVCVAVALLLVAAESRLRLASDTLLGIFAHASLALGLIAVAFMERLRVDLVGYLFGDILAVGAGDLIWIFIGGALVLLALVFMWQPLLSATVHADLATVEGVPVERLRLAFMLLLAIVIASAMRIVGILLVTSLLIIPAAAARQFARSPEQMAILAAGLGALAVGGGIYASLAFDTPSGPSVVVAATVIFAISLLLRRRNA